MSSPVGRTARSRNAPSIRHTKDRCTVPLVTASPIQRLVHLLGSILAFFFLRNRRIIYILDNTFRPDSDLDVLVTFSLDADWSLFDRVQMQQELASIVERQVDLVSNRASDRSQNWIRRREILETAKIIIV
jgi:predicted nucleotidyltransferase